MSRRTDRKHIFCLIFQIPFWRDVTVEEAYDNYMEQLETPIADHEFVRCEFFGTVANLDEIDSIIGANTAGWSVGRLSSADLAILRLASFELLFGVGIPKSVAVNEAVELAKEFSADESPAFINGILGKIAEKSNN